MPSGSNPNSRKNLRPPFNSVTAREAGLKTNSKIKTKIRKYNRLIMHEDIKNTLGVEIEVPQEMYSALLKLGIKVNKRERLSKLIMHKALINAFKKGDVKQVLDLAEFSGLKAPQESKINADVSGQMDNTLKVTIENVK